MRRITRPGLEPLPGNAGETALSENGGAPGGAIGSDSDSVAGLRGQLLDELQAAYKTFSRLDVYEDDPAERKRLAALQDRLSKLISELERSSQ